MVTCVSLQSDTCFRDNLVAGRAAAHVPSVGVAGLSSLASSTGACFLTGPSCPFTLNLCFLGVFFTQTSLQVVFQAGKRVCSPTHDKCLFCD